MKRRDFLAASAAVSVAPVVVGREPTADDHADAEFRTFVHMGRLELKAGDVIAVRSADHLSCEQIEHLRKHVASIFPDHKVLVLGGLEIGVLSEGLR